MNGKLAGSLLAVVAVLGGLSALVKLYDRRLLLVEYGVRPRPCSRCGRRCVGVRRRPAVGAPWGPWHSECCDAPLD